MELGNKEQAVRGASPVEASIEKALVIVRDEQLRPTIGYRYVSDQWPREMRWDLTAKTKYFTPAIAGVYALDNMRKRAREVEEDPTLWELSSTNYELIEALYIEQKHKSNQTMFLTALLKIKAREYIEPDQSKSLIFPSWNGYLSALPLLAEFAIRHGNFQLLLDVLNGIELPNANMAVMWRYLQEAVSLNFNIFSESELQAMPEALKNLRELAERQTYTSKAPRGGIAVKNENFRQGFAAEGREIVSQIDAFIKLCAQAQYFYVKNAIQQKKNIEVEVDKKAVESSLERLGFENLMVKSLDAAEQLNRITSNQFEIKSCLGHLRSFLEQLHIQACGPLAQPGETLPVKWGVATKFLRQHDVITEKEEEFISSLYTLVSDQAIHPLIAEREYARLFRNIVIEYGLLFLTSLEKKGVSLKPNS
jgi:hypothetical protein